ncbi:MAG: hypothetical protein R3300_19145 [Candidatus Promineifilaceae bacterium]|nr:hypothetical protein [Candidatus Promineifilaceae bacterium]
MLVVISDLHFEEEQSDAIPAAQGHAEVNFSRNLPPRLFRNWVAHLAAEAVRTQATRLDLVLAGDLFDIHRTSLWFSDNPDAIRPYQTGEQIDVKLEALVLRILAAIAREEPVAEALGIFRQLASGFYSAAERRAFPVPVQLHYVPGNHDRLLNATAEIRRATRELLGLTGGGEPFDHVLTFEAQQALVRHGHEYDRYNFSREFEGDETIPIRLPREIYAQAPFGDFATIDVASRLPYEFRNYHTVERIRSDIVLRTVYLRLLEFDDLRPQSALLNFLLNIPDAIVDAVTVWRTIEPVIRRILESVHDNTFLEMWLERMDKKWRLDAIDVVQTALALRSWRLAGIPLGLAQFVANTALSNWREQEKPETYASREEAIRNGHYRFLIAGHTHRPATELLAHDSGGERYYINTGTWRNRVPSTVEFSAFGRLKAMTYVTLYGPEEDPGRDGAGGKVRSFDFWSGVTQRWE